VRRILDERIRVAERKPSDGVRAIDAGCGNRSALARFRPRIAYLAGVDIHEPEQRLPWLDEFAVVDLCSDAAWCPPEPVDLILSNFGVEHFDRPQVAFSNLRRWLRADGTLVITTVNRWHPFVDAYLRLPDRARRRLQPMLKSAPLDAHRLVGACNDPRALRGALHDAGFQTVRIETVPNLARAWRRHALTFALGVVGDLVTLRMPARRSSLVVIAR
jgi:SAM-dependent methyltransferase